MKEYMISCHTLLLLEVLLETAATLRVRFPDSNNNNIDYHNDNNNLYFKIYYYSLLKLLLLSFFKSVFQLQLLTYCVKKANLHSRYVEDDDLSVTDLDIYPKNIIIENSS